MDINNDAKDLKEMGNSEIITKDRELKKRGRDNSYHQTHSLL